MDLNFVEKMELIVEHVICVVFAAVIKPGQERLQYEINTICNDLYYRQMATLKFQSLKILITIIM